MSALLRWLGTLLLRGACWLERATPATDTEAWPSGDFHQRVFELRTRIHCGYY